MMLNRADTGVEYIEARAVPMDSLGMPPKMKETILNTLKDEGAGILVPSPNGQRYSIYLKDGEPVASRVVTYRLDTNGQPVAFETTEESDGTLRLLDLSPIFHELASPTSRKVYIIDELDRSLHTLLTTALLEYHLSTRGAATRTQLIFTTHDIMLMTQEIFRRDEMWFIERGDHGGARIECLSDYKEIRFDKDVRKAYVQGHFSGIPRLKAFPERIVKRERKESAPVESFLAINTTARQSALSGVRLRACEDYSFLG
jgi:hypothetical protein